MKLTFPLPAVIALANHARSCNEHNAYYDKTASGPRLVLVGDQGVYLMSNGADSEPDPHVVYAAECDPTKLEFDDWWGNKNASFGPDDGVELIPIDRIPIQPVDGALEIDIDNTKLDIAIVRKNKHAVS